MDLVYQHGIGQKWISVGEDDAASNRGDETRNAAVWHLDSVVVEQAAGVEIMVKR
jgi:hypothetical protein